MKRWRISLVFVILTVTATKADDVLLHDAPHSGLGSADILNDESQLAKITKTGIKAGQDLAEKAINLLFGGNKLGLGSGVGLKMSNKPTGSKTAQISFKGGCTEKPPTPANANVKCSSTSGQCDVKCLEDFAFPDQSTQMQIRCESPGVWKVSKWDTIPDCEPICMPPCQNMGFCLAPNVCECPDGFEGPQCQFAKSKPCLDKPPTPMNSRVVCNEKECISTCNKGFAFPGGGKKLTLICDAGAWTPRIQQAGQSKKVPDCQPVCDPPCQNGGRCLPNNMCECPQEFRGAQCNYPVENCAPERMSFNGGYNCTGGSLSFSCSINCGSDGIFDFPPAPLYTCEYAKAKFLPEPIPQCIFESEQIQYYRTNSSSRSEFLIGQTAELEFDKQQQAKEVEWSWTSHQGFWGRKEYEKYFERFFSGGIDANYAINIPEYSLVRETAARPGTCLAWGGAHFKTFDGKVYSVQSDCRYVMVRDAVSSTFSVVYGRKSVCPEAPHEPCKRFLTIYVEDFVYEIDTQDNGIPYVRKGDQSLRIPNQLDGLLFERVSNFVVIQASGLGFTVKWDTKATLAVDVSDVLWNRTAGLCGRINGFWMDDFENRDGTRSSSLLGFVNSWEASGLTDQCQSSPNEKHACKWDKPEDQTVADEATRMCERLLKDERFENCRTAVDPRPFYEACRWDYCQCSKSNREECACSALETYFHECLRQKVDLPDGWRDATLCPVDCTNGRVYMMCGPVSDETCSGPVTDPATTRPGDLCAEGCYCPKGTALHEGRCISRTQCPCTLRQRTYPSGTQIPNDCNTCTCVAGRWQCTEIRCGSRCSVVGDPHYTTFDGHHFDFMGKCTYYLMKGDNYSVEAENVPCAGAISEAMNFPVKALSTVPSCTKTVTIRSDGDVIKLKQRREVLVNGEEATVEPSVWIDGIYIRHASSVFLSVELPNGLEIWWDGLSRVYIDAPPEFHGNTKGLCGTFNENQRDDMTTPAGDIERSVGAFANGWKTKEVCQDAPVDHEPPHPCDVNAQNKADAERHCAKIKSALFQSCHQEVDPEQFYRDCVYDVCACQVKLSDCLCPAVSAYAKECAHKGALVDWIPDVRECGVHCHGGQSYQVCGNSCTRTCYDIATYPKCRRKCVEGCNCPEGQTLDPFGQCVPIRQCPCLHKGAEYPPGYRQLRPGARSPDVCTCVSARWHCRPATNEEQVELANTTSSAQLQCRASHNEEYTDCEPQYPVTCKTMSEASVKKPAACRPGCQCKKGYVFDASTKRCIRPNECPCHHGGRSYAENERISQDCNTCTCRSARWECTKNECPGMCTNWGESHYKTFDGKQFDFHGNCDYMLAKGTGSEAHEKFQISIQAVPCGSSGVACSKSVTLRLGPADNEESITLTRHKKTPVGKLSERIFVREAGLFVFVEVADLGLVLQWDQGTRIYLRLDPKWKGRVRGLCGNFNDNALDDLQAPSGGVAEVDVKVFGDSWRLQKYCPETLDQIDTCTLHPQRKVWSVMKCNVLKGPLFEKCHAEVPVDYFVEKCVLDACGCDMGGDCECLCTALAAYAHECNIRGVPIKWRSRDLCPLQCDDDCAAYSPCTSTCPAITCENQAGSSSLCSSDACVEGCQPKACPRGQIHRSAKDASCVSIGECRGALCTIVDGVMYAEGDIMEKDACHACYCSKGKRVCQGQPCYGSTALPTTSTTRAPSVWTTPGQHMSASTCRTGWSDWINTHTPKAGADPRDFEPIPRRLNPSLPNSPVCSVDQMVDIECRTVATQISHKKTGENVDCSLHNGLECLPGGVKSRGGACMDYEMRILCDCSASETKKPIFKEPVPPRPPVQLPETCDPARPNRPHPTNCYSFYQCVDRLSGVELVEKTCNPPTMYNPQLMICDWPESVMRVRPECGAPIATTPAPVTTPRPVRPAVAERCDPARPNSPHPTNCHLFYQCVDRLHGVEQVEKTCNPPTMYNPETMVCDWPEAVVRLRPECGAAPTTPKAPLTDSAPCVDGWTDWFNVSSPLGSSGDFELYDAIVTRQPICPKSHVRDVECKFWSREQGTKKGRPPKMTMVDYTLSPDNSVRCEAPTGLLCYNSDQASGRCQDYTVRFLCGCEAAVRPVTTAAPARSTDDDESCPEFYEWSSCAYRCNQLCLAYGSELRRRGYCLTSEGCAPGCLEESDSAQQQQQQTTTTRRTCPPGYFWRDARTCVPARDCTCRTPSGNVVAPGTIVDEDSPEDNCEVCQCLDNEYVCDRSRCQFKWTTVSSSASRNFSMPTRKPRPPGPTLAPAPCSGWSEWINDSRNPLSGDYEMRTVNQLRRAGFCVNGRVSEIECRDVENNRPWTESRSRGLICSLEEGLKCLPHLQGKGGRCVDYKIRYFCECDGNDADFESTTPAATTTTSAAPTTPIIIWTSTTARYGRYEACPTEYLAPLVADHEKIPDSAFTATSSKSSLLGPSSARLMLNPSPENAVSWVAAKRDLDQYVQVDLENPTLVYGFVITGSPTAKEYVTSLYVLYSLDNQRFSYVTNKKGKPKLFRGPLSHNGRQRNLFDVPIEARYVRLEPQTWKHSIAMQFELFGCDFGSDIVVTFKPTRPTRPPVNVCNDQMGLENGAIADRQISFSSVNGASRDVRLGGENAWIPQISSRKEYVLVDLLEPRNISGVVTQGKAGGAAWVESYAVRYSTNGETWHTLLNDDGSQRVFPSNVDADTPYTNTFDRLISTRFVKIVPWQWHEAIALRMDILGCYQPVTATLPPPDVSTPRVTPLPTYCNPCPNIPDDHLNLENCACPSTLSWNGTSCVHPSRCPCFDAHTKYAVGAIFQRHDSCDQCVCRLAGISDCKTPSCPPCAPGLQSVTLTPPKCECSCRPCENGTRLCQSSNACLDESLWCNGVEDCPDDELNCFTTPAGPVECALIECADGYYEENTGLTSADGCPIFNCAPSRTRPTGAPCPEPSCPPGFLLDLQDDYDDEQQLGGQQHFQQLNDLFDQQLSQQSSQSEQFSQLSQSSQLSDHDSQQTDQNQRNCPAYKCIPQSTTQRPTLPPFVLREDRCSMTSRMFHTFDGSEFSYDICDHILVRDRENGAFQISVHKKCSGTWPDHSCARQLRIQHVKESIDLLPNLQVGYKGFEYSVMQAEQIAYAFPGFSINRVGDSIFFRSSDFGFWVVWDQHMNFKIGVTSKLADHIDGLCGYYNLDSHDDQRMPNGELSYSIQDFGNSWAITSHEESQCLNIECSIQEQTAAWDKCSFLRQEPFAQCHGQDESAIERAIFRCVEVMCDCMASTQASAPTAAIAAERCTCQAMSVMAMECHDSHPAVDLNGWRSKYDCSVDCGSGGAVFHECNKQRCETTCHNKMNPNRCPELPHLCYPGCVCPDGLIRNGDDVCVKPSECRDCVCDGFGDPQYFSFDRQNFTFNGNCTYVAARDKLLPFESKTDHDFQVLVKNKDCIGDSGPATCTEEVTIMFQDHVMNVRHSEPTNSLLASLDGSLVENFPLHLPWVRMEKLAEDRVSVLLMAIQVEVSYYLESRSFRVRLPSQLYLNKTEGLCGNCNGYSDDDLHASSGDLANESEEFGLNWLVNKLLKEPPSGEENMCQALPQPECLPPPPEEDPCLKLLDDNAFKMCHAVVDPLPYISACHYDICHSRNPVMKACPSLEAYARECARFQVCLDWRSPDLCPVECPSGMQHRQCGSGCLVTCEQVRSRDASNCPMSVSDGCYCPDGQAFNQALGRCVPLDRCEPCDSEGHYKGDYWKPNPCTTCTCNDEGHVQCSTRSCALEECPFGQERTIAEPAPGECCPSVKCSLDVTVVTKKPCPVVPVPVCGRDQVLRYQDIDSCLQQICECIPSTDCPPMDNPAGYSVVGAKYVVNDTGCCPFLERICLPDQCPSKPECPSFYTLELAPGSETLCCPNYQCAAPKDVCIYEHQYDYLHSQQGWQTLKENEAEFIVPQTEQEDLKQEDLKQELTGVKKTKTGVKRLRAFGLPRGKRSVKIPDTAYIRRYAVNDTWKDGPCLDCVCIAEPHTPIPRYVCTATSCPDPIDSDYVVKAEPVPGECCPRLVRTACQLETRIFKVGEKWASPGRDPCQSYICAELSDGSVVKQLQLESCTTTCPTGWEYRHEDTSVCCGSCQQTTCITEDGSLHALNQTWKSDPCTQSVCVSRENGLQVESTRENCEEPTEEDKSLYAYDKTHLEDVCCPTYRKTACLHNNTEYKADETWSTSDPCISGTCVKMADGQVGRQETVRSCDTECQLGYEYEQPGPTECCGRCVEVACVIDGELHALGTSWNPDPCTTISCIGTRGQVHVTRSEVLCSPLHDCPESNRITKPDECCPYCNATYSQRNCMPEPLPLSKTVGYVVHSSVLHGKCTNTEPIPGLTECFGHCQSRTVHNHDSIEPISECDCCQALDTKELETTLTCANGKTWLHKIHIPTSCNCSPCSGAADDFQQQNNQQAESLAQILEQQTFQQRQGRGDIVFP